MQHTVKQNILSVSQVNNHVKNSLNKNFLNILVQGEISSFKTYPSGHSYLTLKDKTSEISAVIFNQFSSKINNMPNIGSEVIVLGTLSIYEPRGQFQLQIKNLYLAGDGELWIAFEKLKRKLESEGLFDINKKKKLPLFPKIIGIITSSEGAALRDILQILDRRSPHLACHIYPVSVQGANSSREIANAIKDMNKLNEVDLLIVGRGGGSIEDLWSFNEEIVVREIYNSALPIISAVGHETDTTLSDYAADVRAPTPSAAAEIASIDKNEMLQKLDYIQDKILSNIKVLISNYNNRINSLETRHAFYKPNVVLDSWRSRLLEKNNLLMHIINNQLITKINNFELIKDKLKLLNPKSQLNRGYALAINQDGKVIYDINDIGVDDVFKLKLATGELQAKVIKKGK